MSTAEDQADEDNVICPYCQAGYQPEAEDFSEDTRTEECGNCGKKYHIHQSFTITHHTKPDCALNSEEHDYKPRSLGAGRYHDFCAKCDKCKPITE